MGINWGLDGVWCFLNIYKKKWRFKNNKSGVLCMFNFQWRTPCLPEVLCDFAIMAGGALLLVLPQGRFAERMAQD
ncbi:hypothetical protein BJ917_0798 [Pseudomonas sp. WPR_5_2]|nr:hypothetical protein BJ917_0798 [Pseudomonas sp. WPR_5_2]